MNYGQLEVTKEPLYFVRKEWMLKLILFLPLKLLVYDHHDQKSNRTAHTAFVTDETDIETTQAIERSIVAGQEVN